MLNRYEIPWEDVFKSWSRADSDNLSILNEPPTPIELRIDFDSQQGEFVGYDWLSKTEFQHRKSIIDRNTAEFLYFTKPTNKGTTHTLNMLIDAKNEEELAAIWTYAFAEELSGYQIRGFNKYAFGLKTAAWSFLADKYFMWHHAMKRLVSEIYSDWIALDDVEFSSIESIVNLVRINAALILHEYIPVLYSSLQSGEELPNLSLRREDI